jgi:hypothetical protein
VRRAVRGDARLHVVHVRSEGARQQRLRGRIRVAVLRLQRRRGRGPGEAHGLEELQLRVRLAHARLVKRGVQHRLARLRVCVRVCGCRGRGRSGRGCGGRHVSADCKRARRGVPTGDHV